MGNRREQVLAAALAVVVENGSHGLTHRRVDAHAGVPTGTTSNHFPDRLSLARAILRSIPSPDAEYRSQPVDYDTVPGEELLLDWLRARAEFLLGPWRLHALAWYRFIVDGSADPRIRAEIAQVRSAVFEDAKSVVVRCGSTRPDEHTAMLRTFVGALLLVHHIGHYDGDLDPLLVPIARGMTDVIGRDTERG